MFGGACDIQIGGGRGWLPGRANGLRTLWGCGAGLRRGRGRLTVRPFGSRR